MPYHWLLMRSTLLPSLSLYLAVLMLLQALGLSIDVRSCEHCGLEWALSGDLVACAAAAQASCCTAKSACEPTESDSVATPQGCCSLQTLTLADDSPKVAHSTPTAGELTSATPVPAPIPVVVHRAASNLCAVSSRPPDRGHVAAERLTRYRYKWIEQYLI